MEDNVVIFYGCLYWSEHPTRYLDREIAGEVIYGFVPAGSVVISGSLHIQDIEPIVCTAPLLLKK